MIKPPSTWFRIGSNRRVGRIGKDHRCARWGLRYSQDYVQRQREDTGVVTKRGQVTHATARSPPYLSDANSKKGRIRVMFKGLGVSMVIIAVGMLGLPVLVTQLV